MLTVADDRPNGFRLATPGPFHVRDYTNEALTDLEPVFELVDALVEKHKLLIPGSMNRLMRQWRDDLQTAIDAKADTALPVLSTAQRPIAEIEAADEAAETLLTDHRGILSTHLATLLGTFRNDLAALIEDHYGVTGEDDDEPTDRYVEIGLSE